MKTPPAPDPVPIVIIAVATSVIGYILDKVFNQE